MCPQVRTWKLHLFTSIQLALLVVLWLGQQFKAISLSFPFVLMLLIPIRLYLLPLFFNADELSAVRLDGAIVGQAR